MSTDEQKPADEQVPISQEVVEEKSSDQVEEHAGTEEERMIESEPWLPSLFNKPTLKAQN